MSSTIDDRLLLLLKAEAGEQAETWKRLWARLGELTGISSGRWRNFYSGHQKAAADMIEAVGKIWPHHAFWLVTGITDATNGHTAPITALTFPERRYVESPMAGAYFRSSLELSNLLFEQAKVDCSNETERRQAVERVSVFNSWMGSKLVNVAYELCETEAYQALERSWKAREERRAIDMKSMSATHSALGNEVKGESRGHRLKVPDERTKHQYNDELFYRSAK